jgi:hypothetical protein
MRKLVVTRKRHLERESKRLDKHDRHGARRRANRQVDQRVLATILRRNLVDHKGGKDRDEEAVEQEA